MAGSTTKTSADIGGGHKKYTIAWVSDASGNVTDTVDIARGALVQVKFVPGTGGNQPSDLYDIVINDTDGIDVLQGGGANLSQSIGSYVAAPASTKAVLLLEAQTLSLSISNAGNAKAGTIVLYVGF